MDKNKNVKIISIFSIVMAIFGAAGGSASNEGTSASIFISVIMLIFGLIAYYSRANKKSEFIAMIILMVIFGLMGIIFIMMLFVALARGEFSMLLFSIFICAILFIPIFSAVKYVIVLIKEKRKSTENDENNEL